MHGGQCGECALAGRGHGGLDVHDTLRVLADLALREQGTVDERELAGRVDQVAHLRGRDVRGERRHDLGQDDAELGEPGGRGGHESGRFM